MLIIIRLPVIIKFFVDQVRLGDKVDSADATDLPVALAVALLKGADGRITLQVPVGGNVKDPQFDFGQTITSALTGAMENVSSSQSSAVTDSSPSSIITDIDDVKREEVRFIEFEFGLSELSEHATKKLDALAKFLTEKSALTIGIEGTADRQMDLAKMSGKQAKKETPGSKQKAAKAQQKDPAKDQAVDDNQLKMLALMRAYIVKDYLIRKGKVAKKRVQLKPAKIISTTNKEYGRVELYRSAQ
jgi:outer membrane protein OmpA-like peptidoglycan-associated protein